MIGLNSKKKLKGVVKFLCLLVLLTFVGCKSEDPVNNENTITINDDVTIDALVVDTLDKEYYNADELESFIDEEIYNYNYKTMETAITINSVECTAKSAKVSLKYKSYDHYKEFNEQEFFAGTINQAMTQNYLFDPTFLDAKGNEVSVATVTIEPLWYVVIVNEATNVEIPRNIVYVSSNVQITGKKTASTPENELSYIVYK